MSGPPKAFADLADLPEDARIAIIVRAALAGNMCAVFVDDDDVADRYVAKLAQFAVCVSYRGPGLTAGTVLLKVGPREH